MKWLLVVLSCVSILYAGAVWALEGCLDVGMHAHRSQHSERSSQHHNPENSSHHSHTDSSQIHCPNVLSEFLVSSPPSVSAGDSRMHDTAYDWTATRLVNSMALAESAGPPGLVQLKTFPRHLL